MKLPGHTIRGARIVRPRITAVVLLAVAFLLPQYTCSMYFGPSGRVSAVPAEADRSQYRIVQQPGYAWEYLGWTDFGSWLIVAAFFWPVPFVAYRATRRAPRTQWPIWSAEVAAAAGSAYLVLVLSDLGRRAIGAYLALGANAIYAATVLYELLRRTAVAPNTADREARGG